MSDQLVIAISLKLLMGFLASFISIILWSKTRDGAWLTMVLGVVFLFIGLLMDVLRSFGFISIGPVYGEVEILPLIFQTAPFLFFGIGMLIFLIRIRKY